VFPAIGVAMATAAREPPAATRATSPTRRAIPMPPNVHRPRISVVVPTLNEADNVRRAVESARACASTSGCACEVIVVDGGSADDTVACARAAGATVLVAPKGRASQCNVGARHATGDILLFLHADSTLPVGWALLVERALAGTCSSSTSTKPRKPAKEWGTFRFALGDDGFHENDSQKAFAKTKTKHLNSRFQRGCRRVLETLVNARTRLFSRPYGDQGLYLQKELFSELGGFREMCFLEDVEFVGRLRRISAPAIVAAPVTTSPRRFNKLGYVRTSVLNTGIVFAYDIGVSVDKLHDWYVGARGMGSETATNETATNAADGNAARTTD
jgi:glycosyltransferase involved in cell wall biosynthesis